MNNLRLRKSLTKLKLKKNPIDVNFDVDVQEETVVKEVEISEAPVEEEKQMKFLDVVENMPTPSGRNGRLEQIPVQKPEVSYSRHDEWV